MMAQRTYFRPTTAAQRRLLFETWEATGDIDCACQAAHMGRRTFYYWKPRFVAGGYAALETVAGGCRLADAAPPAPSQSTARRPRGRARTPRRAERQAARARWWALRAARRAEVARRREEDAAWRQERQRLRERLTGLTVTAWVAVLVLTDNCTPAVPGPAAVHGRAEGHR